MSDHIQESFDDTMLTIEVYDPSKSTTPAMMNGDSQDKFPIGMSHSARSVMTVVETVTSTVMTSISIVTVTEIRNSARSHSSEPYSVSQTAGQSAWTAGTLSGSVASSATQTGTSQTSDVSNGGNNHFRGNLSALMSSHSSSSSSVETSGPEFARGNNSWLFPQISSPRSSAVISSQAAAMASDPTQPQILSSLGSVAAPTIRGSYPAGVSVQTTSSITSLVMSSSSTSTLTRPIDGNNSPSTSTQTSETTSLSTSSSSASVPGSDDLARPPTTLRGPSTTTIQPANGGNPEQCSTLSLTTTSTITSSISQLYSNGTKAVHSSGLQTNTRASTTKSLIDRPQECFSSSDKVPQPLTGIVIEISIHAIIGKKACDVKTCIELCLSSVACRSMAHTGAHCSLLSVDIGVDLDIKHSPSSPTKYWSRCPWTIQEKRQLGFLDPVLSPVTTALPLAPIISVVQPILGQLAPITSVLSILEPLTTLAAVVQPVASLLDPVISVVRPVATPIISVLGPVESALGPIVSVADPALSGIVSAILPAVTPVPSLLDPLIPVIKTVLSNVDAVATNVLNPFESGLAPVVSGVASVVDPVVSAVQPAETALLSPVGSALSGVIDGVTSVVYPVATPLLSGVLSVATQIGLPVATPIICDIVASDVEHGLLGLNAGCIREQSTATKKTFVSVASAGPSASFQDRNASLVATNTSIPSIPTTLRSVSASAAPCVVTVLVQEYRTLYENQQNLGAASPTGPSYARILI